MTSTLFTGINHLGIAVVDARRSAHVWAQRYGVHDWSIYHYGPHNMSARAVEGPLEFEMIVGLAEIGHGVRIELLQPLDSNSPYWHWLEKHGGRDHLHHVRMNVAGFDEVSGHLSDAGLEISLDAQFNGLDERGPCFRGRYFDSVDDLGFTVEVGEAPEGFAMPGPQDMLESFPLPSRT